MGQIVLAAKVTHVPSLMLSEVEGSPLKSARAGAVGALRELGRRARERGVSTFVVFDTHWLSNFGYHINANARHRGAFTSHEAPHMIQDLHYDLPGDAALAEAIAAEAVKTGLNVIAHKVSSLGLEYGTIVPMHYMNPDGWAKVVSIASPLFTSIEENNRDLQGLPGADVPLAVAAGVMLMLVFGLKAAIFPLYFWLPRAYKDRLRAAGIRMHGFNHRHRVLRFLGPTRIQYRNHRKIVIADGKEAWIGGLNVGDEYMGRSKVFGHWRDTHVRFKGPAVLAALFLSVFGFVVKGLVGGSTLRISRGRGGR